MTYCIFLESKIYFVDFKALGRNLKLRVFLHPFLYLVSSTVFCETPRKMGGAVLLVLLLGGCYHFFYSNRSSPPPPILTLRDLGNREDLNAVEFRVMACGLNFKTAYPLLQKTEKGSGWLLRQKSASDEMAPGSGPNFQIS